jgi:hypothetical protein
MKVLKSQALRVGNRLGIDFDVVPINLFMHGMNVEMEHGKRRGITNVTNDNLLMCGKIALAHMLEYPDYYVYLDKMEERLKKKWKGRRKPAILI